MRIVVIFLLATTFLNCSKSSDNVILPVELNGINDRALYFIDKKGSVITVIKPEYLKSAYDVKINKDTLEVGEEFLGLFSISIENFHIKIESPTSEILDDENHVYRFTPVNKGVFDFKGAIEYDTIVVPFEYKFIVMD